jgi:hypothetical protein
MTGPHWRGVGCRKQSRCRVPGAVGAIEQPAPIGRERQHQPHRPPIAPARRPTAVSVVTIRSSSSMIAMVSAKSAISGPRFYQRCASRTCADLGLCSTFRQRDQRQTRQLAERSQGCERGGAVAVIDMRRPPCPGKAEPVIAGRRQSRKPVSLCCDLPPDRHEDRGSARGSSAGRSQSASADRRAHNRKQNPAEVPNGRRLSPHPPAGRPPGGSPSCRRQQYWDSVGGSVPAARDWIGAFHGRDGTGGAIAARLRDAVIYPARGMLRRSSLPWATH